MARTVYSYELQDEDFTWLLNNYLEENPSSFTLQVQGCPVIVLSDCSIKKENTCCSEHTETNEESCLNLENELFELLRKPNT